MANLQGYERGVILPACLCLCASARQQLARAEVTGHATLRCFVDWIFINFILFPDVRERRLWGFVTFICQPAEILSGGSEPAAPMIGAVALINGTSFMA